MRSRHNRRRFLQSAAILSVAGSRVFAAPSFLSDPSPNSKLNIAGIGVGGRGHAHVETSAVENLVAVCDAVESATNGAVGWIERYDREHELHRPLPKVFADYREMLDKMGKQIDAVFVSTPDHHHAPASMRAMKMGKHVYCEKPLTHSVDEARKMTLAAREHKVATQMGNGGRADVGWRELCEMVWSGVIGQVTEVHVWTDRPGIPSRFWWPQGGGRPAGADPIPKGLNWDVWLGPAAERPYLGGYKEGKFRGKPVYQPFVWRGWWDFGTGALGDIGCHALSGTFSALKIEHAAAAELVRDTGDGTSEMFPGASTIRWEIPARGDMNACQIYWYDGGMYPPPEVGELAAGQTYPDNGTILVGDKGKMTFYGRPRLLPDSRMQGYTKPDPVIPRCESTHFGEWVTACKGGRAPFSNFDHAGPLTELVLLGNLAIRAGVGKKVEWDGPNMKCTNHPEIDAYVQRVYRSGWEL